MSAPAPPSVYVGGPPPGVPQQPPSAEYVPAPTQFGNLEMAGANAQMRPPLNQELTIAKLENTMASMEDQHLTNDPRYQQIARLKQRIAGQPLPTQGDHTNPATPGNGEDDSSRGFSQDQLQQLKAQVDVYKLLARQEQVPTALSNVAIKLKPNSLLPEPYEFPGETDSGEKLPYDMIKVFQIHTSRSNTRRTAVNNPPGIDPQYILKERENRLQNRIGTRIRNLQLLPASVPAHLNIKAQIELRALRLVNFQQQMRRDVMSQLKRDSMFETALNPHAYRRTKSQSLREARITEKLEKQQKLEQEKRRRQQHMELLQAIMQQGKEFKDFHRNNQVKNGKLKKAILTYYANSERERRKDEQKNEKLRMMKLIQEDEEGYRQLLDEKKDQRLVYLLQQTDEFVTSLTGLVKAHQATEQTRKSTARKEDRRKQMEGRTPVRSLTTGQVLRGDDAPRTEELDAWMNAHPGFEIISVDDIEDSGDEDYDTADTDEKKEDKDDEFEGLDEEQRNKKIIEKARNEDDEYDQKSKSNAKFESYYATAHRIREKIVKQHSTMGGGNPELQLKPYQIKGLEWMVSLYNNNLNGILADEMGLGKTIQTIALVTYLMEVKKVNGPYLIIVPLSTISNWALELEKWAPNVHKIVYKGDKDTRKRMDTVIKRGAFNVLLTTYDYVLKEKAVLGKLQWKYMIIDEGHRMKNHNCKLSLILNKEFQAQHRILLTGTPLQNKLPELWALLNFLLPSIFSSCHTFEQWFNAPFATTGEKVELNQEETMLIIRRLHKVLRPFLLRRLKKEVESQLPDKTEYLLKCDMSALQKILYRHMQKGFLIDQRNPNGTRALANTLMHLRKLCNHPFLFENVEQDCKEFWKVDHISGKELYRVSGKFELLDRILPKLKAGGHRVLIFCQMTSLMNVMEDYFLYRNWKYLRLDGSTKPDDRGELLKKYNAPNSDIFIFMLSTRAGGLGLNLQTADTVIIFDSDWNPHQDMQAQDRAHRIGQKREVRVFRLITVNSVEERILAAAKYKLNMDSKVIQAGKFDQRSTGAERRQMLERIIQEESDEEDEDDVPDDDAINEMLARLPNELDLFMKMDIERRRAEAEDDPRNRKPRLVEENEIPDNIIKFNEKFTQDGEIIGETSFADIALDSGRRRRREVDYSADLMSEQEFMKKLEDDEDEEASRSSSKRSRKSEKTPGRSKRKRADLDDDDDDESQFVGGETPSRKKKRGPNAEFSEIVNRCIKSLLEYNSRDGRRIAAVFESLPSRRELPDYYEIIEKPMDIKRIQRRLSEGRYSTLDDVTADIHLLGSNARKYNQDGSDIYNDSKLVEAVWKQLADNFDRPASSASTQNSSSGDVTPSGSRKRRDE